MPPSSTCHKILDAAEKLFVDNGFSGTSLRAIIKQAGVNTAAVHYYYRSKTGLIEAVFARRKEPLNSERLARLRALEARHPDGPLPLEEIVESFLLPLFNRFFSGDPEARLFPQLMGRAHTDPDPSIRRILHEQFEEITRRYRAALLRALPNLSPEEIRWRAHFMLGAMAFTLMIPLFPDSSAPPSPVYHSQAVFRSLVTFVCAGFLAPGNRPS
jgi:AcrR family transcriptional regulator